MVEKLLNFIKENERYADITDFIAANFKELDCDIENTAYYKYARTVYELSSELSLITKASFDYFGASMAGSESIYIESFVRDDEYTLFNHEICTNSKGVVSTNEVTIFDENNRAKIVSLYNETNINNEDVFVVLYEERNDNAISYWKMLPEQIRNKKENVSRLLDLVYDKAENIYRKFREYDSISPFGGCDIKYRPASIDVCFVDQMDEYRGLLDSVSNDIDALIEDYLLTKNKKAV